MARFYTSSKQWRRRRLEVFHRDGYRCRACGKAGVLECDHIIPRQRGGAEYDMENLQTLCRGCHIQKTAGEQPRAEPRTLEQRRFRALVEDLL